MTWILAILEEMKDFYIEKLEIGLREKFFLKTRNWFSKISISKLNEIEDNNEKYIVDSARQFPKKIDFPVYSLHRDHPPAWVLKAKWSMKKMKAEVEQSEMTCHVTRVDSSRAFELWKSSRLEQIEQMFRDDSFFDKCSILWLWTEIWPISSFVINFHAYVIITEIINWNFSTKISSFSHFKIIIMIKM